VTEHTLQGLPARTNAVVHLERDVFEKVQWHDGSRLAMGDIMLGWILTFDRAMDASVIFDESVLPSFESFVQTFRGFRIISENPLVAEIYSDAFSLDAEEIGRAHV